MTRAKDISKIVTDADLSGTLDVTGTVTAGGLSVQEASSGRVLTGIFQNTTNAAGTSSGISLRNSADTTSVNLTAERVGSNAGADLVITGFDNSGVEKNFMRITEGNDISFYEDTGTTPKLFWDASAESLGIGHSSPNVTLHVQGANVSSGDANYNVSIDDSTSMAQGVGGGIAFKGSYGPAITSGGFIQTEKSNGTSGDYAFDLVLGSRPNGGVPTERMRIDSSGNVGIGGTSFNPKLYVLNNNAGPFLTAANATAVFHGSVDIGKGGCIGFDFGASHTNYPVGMGYVIESQSGSTKGSLVFGTRSVTTDTAPTERMRITEDGNVKIGDASTDVTSKLTVSGNGSQNTATFMYDGNAGTYLDIDTEAANGVVRLRADARSGNYPSFIIKTATSDALIIDNSQRVTMPNQPAFQVAKVSAEQSNIAVGSHVTIVFDGEIFDQNSDVASNTFTAPVTGKYQLNTNVRIKAVDSAAVYYHVRIVTSNRVYGTIFDPDFGQDADYWSLNMAVLADMDASDTAYVTIFQSSGTQQMDIVNDAGATNFSGYLVA
jgi:hypothetical protein